jgi:DNA invertase Pin-like site-specific DNA recombinase
MNTRQTDNQKITALYERLSSDDERDNESLSIENQKKSLEDYARKNGFRNLRHFTDDGISGTQFDRPGLNEMLREVEAGRVETVIIKDMSRAGRDYLRVGLFMETLREHGVRLIAPEDSVDSLKGYDDFLPFRNIINEWAARDSSRKVRAVMRAKGMEGKRLTTSPIYGYLTDPNDKEKWIPDEVAAPIVRRIFQLTIAGHGPHEIARIFSGEKVERPSYHQAKHGIGTYAHNCNKDRPYAWNASTIGSILSKPEYMGHTVNFRFYKDSYKDKQHKENPKEKWMIFENTHPEIVDPEMWETAQRCRKTVKRIDSLGEANPLTGKLFCADCGAKMYNHRKPYKTPHYRNPNTGTLYMRAPSDLYCCGTHSTAKAKFEKACSLHHINTRTARAIILEVIQAASAFAQNNEAEFVKWTREASEVQQEKTAQAYRKRLAKAESRIAELSTIIQQLFEDKALGRLSEKRFEALSATYEKEQDELEQSAAEIQTALDSFHADSQRADKFIELAKRYTDFSELTTPMINEFIDKILVHEADRSSGDRVQDVDVYLNFIGRFEVPPVDLTPEEIAEIERKKHARAKRREYEARYRAKIREKRLRKTV